MSEEIAKRITDAKAEEAEQQKLVDELKQQCLNAVAAGIPAGAEKYAKKIVHEQPEVTKSLDRAGVSALRTEISEAAAALADEVKGAAALIEWPESGSGRDGVATAFLFQLVHPSTVERLASWCESWTGVLRDGTEAEIELMEGVTVQLWGEAFRRMAADPIGY